MRCPPRRPFPDGPPLFGDQGLFAAATDWVFLGVRCDSTHPQATSDASQASLHFRPACGIASTGALIKQPFWALNARSCLSCHVPPSHSVFSRWRSVSPQILLWFVHCSWAVWITMSLQNAAPHVVGVFRVLGVRLFGIHFFFFYSAVMSFIGMTVHCSRFHLS